MLNKQAQLKPYTGEEEAPIKPVSISTPSHPQERRPTSIQTDVSVSQNVSNTVFVMQTKLVSLYKLLISNSDIVQWFKNEGNFASIILNRNIHQIPVQPANENLYSNMNLPKADFLQHVEMLHILGPKKTGPDGKWGPYTNMALGAAWSIGFSFISIVSKFSSAKFSLKTDDLDELKKYIPEDPTKIDDEKKNELAKEISPVLDKIVKSVNEFVIAMLDISHKQSGNGKFNVFQSSQIGLSKEDQLKFTELQNQPIPGISVEGQAITYKDIVNQKNFQNYLRITGLILKKNTTDVINELKRQISVALESASKAQESQKQPSTQTAVNPAQRYEV